jgi:DNA-binding NtrC family response regulator
MTKKINSKSEPVYQSIDDVPVPANIAKRQLITRHDTIMSTYDVIELDEFILQLKKYRNNQVEHGQSCTIELDREEGYYDYETVHLKVNYFQIESDKEYDTRLKAYKKQQFDKYSAIAHQKRAQQLEKTNAEERKLYEKLKKKYGNKI